MFRLIFLIFFPLRSRIVTNKHERTKMPGPIRRALRRTAVRAAVGPVGPARRVARRMARRTARRVFRRRVAVGSLVIFGAIAGGPSTEVPLKMSSTDAQKVESSTGKPVEELSEEELKLAMKRLGIQKIELRPDEQRLISNPPAVEGEFECSECHSSVTAAQKFCPSCGSELQ